MIGSLDPIQSTASIDSHLMEKIKLKIAYLA